jgi:murein DD-endopeptidase MepM/ murein hydrolase activator NlpD
MRTGGPRTGIKGLGFGVAVLVAVGFALALAATRSTARTASALRVEVSGLGQRVRGSDEREHIEYDLIVSDAFTAPATLRSLEVRTGRHRLLSLSGSRLAASTLALGTSAQTDGRVGSGSTVVIQVDIVLPSSAGRTVPASVINRLSYSIPADAPARPIIGTTMVQMPPLRVARRAPVVIASPLRGTGWINANGCCDDPTSPHRQTVLSTSTGGYSTPEMFAIDWIREVGGRFHRGDGLRNSDWPTFGAPLYAVANGTVVVARDGRPDIPPRTKNLNLRTPNDFGGNHVFLKIGPGLYACYAHLRRGSLRVRTGQRVKVGQRIGLTGNSGNTDGPHLHFGIQRRADCLSDSEPFEIDHYRLQGTVAPSSEPPRVDLVGAKRRECSSLPLIRSVVTFLAPLRLRHHQPFNREPGG